MKTSKYKNLILVALFLLPISFLLLLIPAQHNYIPLDTLHKISSNDVFVDTNGVTYNLEGKLHIIIFLGNQEKLDLTAALNVKELIYNKFKGFKGFEILAILPHQAKSRLKEIKSSISSYENLKYWKYLFSSPDNIENFYQELKGNSSGIAPNGYSPYVFLTDQDLMIRGRRDDRSKKEIKKQTESYSLSAYNSIDVREIKEKLVDDLRILFTEIRDKRRGKFKSHQRRTQELRNE